MPGNGRKVSAKIKRRTPLVLALIGKYVALAADILRPPRALVLNGDAALRLVHVRHSVMWPTTGDDHNQHYQQGSTPT
jgi:hypothetical protein